MYRNLFSPWNCCVEQLSGSRKQAFPPHLLVAHLPSFLKRRILGSGMGSGVDILFFGDTSMSMTEELETLGTKMTSFVEGLVSTPMIGS